MKQAPGADKLYRMAIKMHRPIPKELAEAPQVWPWLVLFQRAFWDLMGDRLTPRGMISWSARQHWAEVHGLDEEATDLLHHHVKAQDIAYLGHLRDTAPQGDGVNHGGPGPIRGKHD